MPGYDSWFSYPKADPRELPFGIGLAIFSRTRLQDPTRIDVPSPAIEFVFRGRKTTPTDRLMIGARTTVDGREIQIYNVHLLAFFMLGASSTAFPWQRELVADRLDASDLPTILGGDFNVSPDDPIVEQFAGHGFATVQQKVPTWRRQPYVLDHIFHNLRLRCVRYSVETTAVSDHLPVVADFEHVPPPAS
jgi:endonuclease/exonuclease/phosphatase (EEP) superfamily protein YafD